MSIRDGKKRMGYGQPETLSWTARMEPGENTEKEMFFVRKDGTTDTIQTSGKQFVFVEHTGKTHFTADSITLNVTTIEGQPDALQMETIVEMDEKNGGKGVSVNF